MGVKRDILKAGNSVDKHVKNDEVTVGYKGCLYDTNKEDSHFMGDEFDKREGFKFTIGAGKVIRGWDEVLLEMTLGEKSILTITPDYTYGNIGFPGLIPPNSTLVFEVCLQEINGKVAEPAA
ncbi:hypothetical protein I7I51_07507 [Histoplasma capsulatum]|uniref:peptidylprolyl isomerase n=1 Tax=Ajellomyces capsulatus TaxID=5037 RepID=A0A8A1LXY9_AJECA|nr:hypothetical protein I7I51_07507 [Histoplasma capsulatum]